MKPLSSLMVFIFWCFSAPSNPTELVSISADRKQWKTGTKRRGARWKTQNNFSDVMPEAERFCRWTRCLHLPSELKRRSFKRRQKQWASLLTGQRAGGTRWGVAHLSGFEFITCDCWTACGSPDKSTAREEEPSNIPNCLRLLPCIKGPVNNLIKDSSTNPAN